MSSDNRPDEQTLPHLKHTCHQSPKSHVQTQINQDEAHPPPRRHDGALLRPRARRPKQGPIEIRQERGKVKGPGSVS